MPMLMVWLTNMIRVGNTPVKIRFEPQYSVMQADDYEYAGGIGTPRASRSCRVTGRGDYLKVIS